MTINLKCKIHIPEWQNAEKTGNISNDLFDMNQIFLNENTDRLSSQFKIE